MASDLQSKSPPKFEAFVENQLAAVRRRMRALDVGAAALLMLAVVLAYAVLMAVFDLMVEGSEAGWALGVRLGMFGLFVVALLACGWMLIARLVRRINPYYAARRLEETVPDAKNSVINWLDLKDERLPSSIRASLGNRAAQDLRQADTDEVLDKRPNVLLGSLAGVFVVALIVIFATGPNRFGSLLARAFAPFRSVQLAQRATIKLLRPAGGDLVVKQGERVEFVAEIDGRFPRVNHPGAPALHYRYGAQDPFLTKPLEEDANGNWTGTLVADQVQNGFWYKLTAGDASTPEHQVQVRSAPHAVRYEVAYRYRPYLLVPGETEVFPNEKAVFPKIIAHRGTEVTLTVQASQPVNDAAVELGIDKQTHNAALQAGEDGKTLRATWVLQKSGTFAVKFKSNDGTSNTDRGPFEMIVLEDSVPVVTLTEPGKDITAAANAAVTLVGEARDDFGVKGLALQLRILEGVMKADLAAKPYRPGKSFQFETGGYPAKIEYRDVVPLDKLATVEGKPFAAAPGTVLEYWLEATDNSDFPNSLGNVGKSKTYKITVGPPQDDKKQQEEKQQAEQKQKEHEKKQDDQHQKQDKEKQQEAADAGKTPEEKRADDLKRKMDETKEKAQKELERKEKQEKQEQQGQAKGEDPQKGENKSNQGENPETNAKEKGQENQKPDAKQTGDKKDQGPQNDKTQAAQSKTDKTDANKQPDSSQACECKNEGNGQKPGAAAKGGDSEKSPDSKNGDQNAKGGPKDQPKEQPAQAKDEGNQGSKEQNSQAKSNGPKESPEQSQGGQAKSGDGAKESPTPQAKNDEPKNDKQAAGQKGDSKPGTNEKLTNEKGPGNTKPDATASKNPPGEDGTRRPAQAKGDDEPARKSTAKNTPPENSSTETKQGPPAQAKGQPEKKGLEPNGTAKETPAEQTKDSAVAKNDGAEPKTPREPSMKDIEKDMERLKDQLTKNDPQALKEAKELAKKLAKDIKNIKDPEVRKTAEEMIQQAAKQKTPDQRPPETAKNQDPNDMGPSSKPGPMNQEPMTAQGGNDTKPAPSKGSPEKQAPKDGPDQKPGNKSDETGPNGQGVQDDLKKQGPDKALADRGGDLQLEKFLEQMTPEMRKAAGISDQEWQDYLKNAQAYEQLRQKQQGPKKTEPTEKRGALSQLAPSAPRQVRNLNGQLDPVQAGQAVPPPELREAQRRFTEKK